MAGIGVSTTQGGGPELTTDATLLPPLARTSLVDATTELLRLRILEGAFEPGARLVESEIARRLQVSRAPVREAFARLRVEGLTRDEPGRGTYVTALDRRDVEEIYEMRAALESAAARLVIENDDPTLTVALEAAVDGMRAAAARRDRHGFVEADLALHGVICRGSGNARLVRNWETQIGLTRALIRLETERLVSTFEPILEEHENLVAEILSRDVNRATAAAWSLFRRTSRVLADGVSASIEGPAVPRQMSALDHEAGGPPG